MKVLRMTRGVDAFMSLAAGLWQADWIKFKY